MTILKETYSFAFTLFREQRRAMIAFAILFVGAVVAGFFLPADMKRELLLSLGEKFADASSESPSAVFWFIFWNNTFVAFLLLILGLTVIGPALLLLMNGFFIGVLLDVLSRAVGVDAGLVSTMVAGLVPHGVLEIPAIIFAALLSSLVGVKLYLKKKVSPALTRMQFLGKALLVYLFLIVPLLFFAAIVESTVTPALSEIAVERAMQAEEHHPAFDGVMVTAEELSSAGIDAVAVSLADVELGELSSEQYRQAFDNLAILFDEHVYASYKEIRQRPNMRRSFLRQDELLNIELLSFDAKEQAEGAVTFLSEMFPDDTQKVAGQAGERVVGSQGKYLYQIVWYGEEEGVARQAEIPVQSKLSQ